MNDSLKKEAREKLAMLAGSFDDDAMVVAIAAVDEIVDRAYQAGQKENMGVCGICGNNMHAYNSGRKTGLLQAAEITRKLKHEHAFDDGSVINHEPTFWNGDVQFGHNRAIEAIATTIEKGEGV